MTDMPRIGDTVRTPDHGEGTVESVLIPGTREYAPPYYRDDDTEVYDVPLLAVRYATHSLRHYFLDELLPMQRGLL